MILSHTPPFILVHVPRTGGTSLTLALSRRLPHATVDWHEGKHRTARELSRLRLWSEALVVAFWRPPHEILASWYANACTWFRRYHRVPRIPDQRPPTRAWVAYATDLASLSFDEWLERDVWTGKWPPSVTFRETWLEPHLDQILLYDFRRYRDAWTDLTKRLGVPSRPLPPTDRTADPDLRPQITGELIARCRRHFCADYELCEMRDRPLSPVTACYLRG